MGRKTYEATRGQGGGMMGMKAYVFSTTLRPADCPGATLATDPRAAVRDLKAQPGKHLWLFGGGALFQSFLDQGLVDKVLVAIVPVLLGGGLPMLVPPAAMTKLRLVSHRVYAQTGTVLLEYEVMRTAPTSA